MTDRDADSGVGIPVLVMRESPMRSLFSHACAWKSITREDYSGHLIEKCIEDIDSFQTDARQDRSGARDVGFPGADPEGGDDKMAA